MGGDVGLDLVLSQLCRIFEGIVDLPTAIISNLFGLEDGGDKYIDHGLP